MKKTILFLSVLAMATFAAAQDVAIPVFDDITADTPKIGRTADPLDSLILTPKPLPEVDVILDGTKKAEQPKKTEASKEPVVKTEKKPLSSSAPISLRKENAVIKITRTEKKEVETPSPPAPVPMPMPEETEPLSAAEPFVSPQMQPMPAVQTQDGLEHLFGKVHDVKGFEVAGLALGMTPDEAQEAMIEQGYKRTKISYGIPMFRTSFYEQACRDKKIYPLKDIRKCIEGQAADDEVKYVSSMTFANKKTNEYVQVLFSSNATENTAFKVYYESRGDNSLSMTTRNLAKQLRRKDMFWKMMFDTYGLPDDSELVVWGDLQKVYMQAMMNGTSYNAYIILEDKEIQDADYFAAEDSNKELEYPKQFTFSGEE